MRPNSMRTISLVRRMWCELPASLSRASMLIGRVHFTRRFATAPAPAAASERSFAPPTVSSSKKSVQTNLCRIVIPPLPQGAATFLTLHVDYRPVVGTGMARYLRRQRNFFPATINTPFADDRINIAIERTYFERIVKQCGGDLQFCTRVISLVINNVDGEQQTYSAICRDVYRHTVTDAPLSATFLLFVPKRKVRLELPIEYVNIDQCIGVAKDSEILPMRHSLPCTWTGDAATPSAVEIDMTLADVGRVIRTSEAAAAAASIPSLQFIYRGGVDRVITVVTGLGGANDLDDEDEAAAATATAAKATPTKAAATKAPAAGAAGKKGDDAPAPAAEKGKKK